MDPIIGIITRKNLSESKHKIEIFYKDLENAIIKSGGIPIGISNDNIDIYLNLCQGFILQGGDDIDEQNLIAIKKILSKNKPILGICLGMQEIATYYGSLLYDINNHKTNTLHEIIIDKNSLLYKIIGKEKILINSRHKSAIKNTNLKVSSKSLDNIIESIESNTDTPLIIGLQWHPENLYNIDLNSKKIFDYFINICHH